MENGIVTVYGAKCIGIEAIPVRVEVNMESGLGIHLVGLADVAVKESLLRTMTAIQSVGLKVPGKKIVINLAPADLHKNGSGYDLPIALGILAAAEQADMSLSGRLVAMGELGLDGTVRPVPGALPMSEMASLSGFDGIILPWESAQETLGFDGTRVYGVRTLLEAVQVMSGNLTPDCISPSGNGYPRAGGNGNSGSGGSPSGNGNSGAGGPPSGNADRVSPEEDVMDFADIVGQDAAKRGLEVAAAGGHNVLLIGPPGAGKSSLARATAAFLPPLTQQEAMQTSKIYSVAGLRHHSPMTGGGLMRQRPFRSPHHSASTAALLGGGSDRIIPGEISLAHNGVLFIDEFCDAPKRFTEALRAPMEDRKVTISRMKNKITYPADFMLIAATNPCPCGYYGDGDRCTCTPAKRLAYMSRLSGPIMDRIDIQLWINPVKPVDLVSKKKGEPSSEIARRVLKAREIQTERFREYGIFTNAAMSSRLIDRFCVLDEECRLFLERAMELTGLSARACTRVLKIARTIADLEGSPDIRLPHLSEAISYRFLDKPL